MIKWPWKTNEAGRDVALPWDDALTIPVLANLNPDEQSKLVQLADRFLQQKRLVPLQGFELDPLKNARIALLFCLPVLELGIEWLDGFHEVLIYPAPFVVDDEWPSLLFVPDLSASPVDTSENAAWPEDGTEAALAA